MKEIIKKFKELREKFNLNFDDGLLFSEANKLYISMGIQKGYKDIEKTEITQQKPQKQEIEPIKQIGRRPTEKMLYFMNKAWKTRDGKEYLKEIGFNGDFELLTFDKAKELISKVKNKQKDY